MLPTLSADKARGCPVIRIMRHREGVQTNTDLTHTTLCTQADLAEWLETLASDIHRRCESHRYVLHLCALI
jgi:hypothetical protein